MLEYDIIIIIHTHNTDRQTGMSHISTNYKHSRTYIGNGNMYVRIIHYIGALQV